MKRMAYKNIRKKGRNWGKAKYHLNEDDYIDLAHIEEAYLAGYRYAKKEEKDKKIIVYKSIF